MKRYSVVVLVDATAYIEVSANSAEEAMDKAMEEIEAPSICHQCSDKLDVGDVVRALEAVEI